MTATAITAIALPSLFAMHPTRDALADGQHLSPVKHQQQKLHIANTAFNKKSLGYATATWKASTLKVHTTLSAQLSSIDLPVASKVVLPLSPWSHITSGFGPRSAPCSGCSTSHKGIDLSASVGTKVQSIAAGIVIDVDTNGAMGEYVDVLHDINNKLVVSHYQHLSKSNVMVGDKVSAGQTIGLSGDSGVGTGPHLHFEVEVGTSSYDSTWAHSVDPDAWLAKHVKGYQRETNDAWTYDGPSDGSEG